MVKSIEELKAKAIAEVYVKDPLCTYKRLLKGREAEYTFRQYLDDLAPPEVVEAETVIEEPETNAGN